MNKLSILTDFEPVLSKFLNLRFIQVAGNPSKLN